MIQPILIDFSEMSLSFGGYIFSEGWLRGDMFSEMKRGGTMSFSFSSGIAISE